MSVLAVLAPLAAPRRRPSFAGAVRAELLKLRRMRLLWVLSALLMAAAGLTLILVLNSSQPRDALQHSPLAFYFFYLTGVSALFDTGAGIVLLVAASRLVGLEYSSGAIRVVLARGTGRLHLLAAQLAATALMAMALTAVFAVAFAGLLALLVLIWHGSLDPITSLPAIAWHDTWITAGVAGLSEVACILLAAAATVVGRSLAFGVGVAMGFFPADNFGTIVMFLIHRITNQDAWLQATQWFLGPNLNVLPGLLITDHRVQNIAAEPLVKVTAGHSLWVVAAYMAIFLVLAIGLTRRRDVLE